MIHGGFEPRNSSFTPHCPVLHAQNGHFGIAAKFQDEQIRSATSDLPVVRQNVTASYLNKAQEKYSAMKGSVK